MRKWCIGAIVIAMLVAPSLAACPNKCSGHGKCGKSDVCDCMQNWMGGDCAGRVCPYTRAWHDTAEGNNDAHYYAECGNRGVCNRETGVCECDEPFTGSGCRRMGCPGDCSGHGTCEFIEELAADGYNKRVGGDWLRTYTLWDQEKIMGCRCDPGFEGHNCARRTCPKGDDPLTEVGTEMVQLITFTMTGSGFLTYHDPYGNAWTTERISLDDGSATDVEACANIQEALRRLPNNVLNTVDVAPAATYYPFTRTTSDSGSVAAQVTTAGAPIAACTVKFRSEPGTTGYQNHLDCDVSAHNAVGQHPMTAGNAATCTVIETWIQPAGSTLPGAFPAAVTRPLTELVECSNRGSCDYTTGMCKCFTGHMGLACQKQEALV